MTDHDSTASNDQHLEALGSLAEPTRRALYRYVAGHGGWVSRELAATAAGIGRTLAAHHLDRLAADGLLEVDYQRTTPRRGPGAGRPAKLYRRGPRQLDVSLPPRQYELAATLLADAVQIARSHRVPLDTALDHTARAAGQAKAATVRPTLPHQPSTRQARRAVIAELQSAGYEPLEEPDGVIVLRNCPFHPLARRHTELVCGLNHRLLDSFLRGLPAPALDARLAPHEHHCCVQIHPRP